MSETVTDKDLWIYTRQYANGQRIDAPTILTAEDVTIQLADIEEVVIRRRDGGVNRLKLMNETANEPNDRRWDVV